MRVRGPDGRGFHADAQFRHVCWQSRELSALSGSLMVRTQIGNCRMEGRDLVAGAASVFVSQAFAILDHGTI